jgi:RNA polymerase sigma-70 factor (ECF subfamily)
MSIVEEQIIKECQRGNLEKFSLIYDKYVKKIYQFIYYRVFYREIAEDLTSQTFFKALEKINTFSFKKSGSVGAWLYCIARNNVIDYTRVNKREVSLEEAKEKKSFDRMEEKIDCLQKIEKVKDCLKILNYEQKEIIIMRVWQEMSYQEISQTLGKSEASCKMAFSRGINKIRENFGNLLPSLLLFVYFKRG